MNDAASRRYSNYRAPTSFTSAKLKDNIRSFSTGEVVLHDPGLSSPASKTASAATKTSETAAKTTISAAVSDTFQSQTPDNIIDHQAHEDATHKVVLELQEAIGVFRQIYTEAQVLLRNSKSSTTSDEVVAMADYFLTVVNSLQVENSLGIVQSFQRVLHEKEEKDKKIVKILHEGEWQLEEKLHQATKSMNQFHYVFLKMVESCLPSLRKEMDKQSKPVHNSVIPSFNKDLYSAMTVRRALQLSRRAEKLCIPMHLSLYQHLAMGIVLTCALDTKVSRHPTKNTTESEIAEKSNDELPSSILPGKFQQTLPVSFQLLDTFQHACLALKITSLDQLHQLGEDLFAGPFLMLMEQKQYEECLSLLHGWHGLFGHNDAKINLIDLLGEHHALDALEIAKGWLIGPLSAEDVKNPHIMQLSTLLEAAVSEIWNGQREHVEKLSQLLRKLSLCRDIEDNIFGHESDSESDFEDGFEFDSDGEEVKTEMPTTTHADLSITTHFIGERKVESIYFPKVHDKYKSTISTIIDGTNTFERENEHGDGTKEAGDIVEQGDKERCRSIYLRNGVDWVLPDAVPQLEDWNKGNPLTFTPEFGRYLDQQIKKEGNADFMD